MLLAALAETSRRVAETPKRLEKIDAIAQLLGQAHGEEIEIAVAFLSGQLRQGRIGAGYAAIREAVGPPAQTASLELLEVARAFEAISTTSGAGSQRRRFELLQNLFARATACR